MYLSVPEVDVRATIDRHTSHIAMAHRPLHLEIYVRHLRIARPYRGLWRAYEGVVHASEYLQGLGG